MVYKILISLLLSAQVFSYTPTVEGLFRNGANHDISKDLIMLQLEASRVDLPEMNKRFIKILFFPEDQNFNVIQVEYADDSMKENEILRVSSSQNFTQLLESSNALPSLFYSVLSCLVMNRAIEMDQLLKRITPEYQSASSFINEEKLALFNQYKEYLQQEDKEELTNPMKPEEPEEKERVEKIKDEPFYRPSFKVSLEREHYTFLWKVDFQSFKALFNHQNHTLKMIEAYLTDQWVKMVFSPHVLFNGVHQLPSTFEIDLAERGKFQLKTLKLVHLNSRGKGFVRRRNEYLKRDQRSPLESPTQWPFLL